MTADDGPVSGGRGGPQPEDAIGGGGGAGFEAVLAAAAYRGISRVLPSPDLARMAWALARDPRVPARHLMDLAVGWGRIGLGASSGGEALDRRFGDSAWVENPWLNRIALGYLSYCTAALDLFEDLDLDWRTRERLRLLIDNVLAAQAPTNSLLLNPSGWKRVIDTAGGSIGAGLSGMLRDLRSPTKLPSSVDRRAFTIGSDIAATPGSVIRRSRLFELIEYKPTTDDVDVVPVVMVSSPVNKYYLLDLEPDRSVIGAELALGRRVFAVSWVNPDVSHADVGFDEYVTAILEVLATVEVVTQAGSAHLLGLCAGGQLSVMAAGYLAAVGRQDELATLTVGISVIDFGAPMASMAFLDRKTATKAIRKATKRGFFDASDSARFFAMLRPNEGIWANVVNNYVLGKPPPAMSVLYWALDQTNLTAKYGADMIEASLDNSLARAGGLTVLGEPIDLGALTVDTYILGASTDHISPWQDCYRTTALLGGEVTFVLARGGHAIAVAKPVGTPRSTHWTSEITGTDPAVWFEGARACPGTWWEHWNAWIEKRTPARRLAPERLGSDMFPPVDDAPGEYVHRVLTGG